MMHLTLRRNESHGGIPREICRLNQIQMLDLSGNNISGRIPPSCFNNFTSLVQRRFASLDYIVYTFVLRKGQESEYKNTLGLVKLINLSSNKLVGSIPKEFSNVRGLISLNFSRNSLTGNLDPNIGGIEMLESIDLSRNQLSGEIPISLSDESSFGGNSNLCGNPSSCAPGEENDGFFSISFMQQLGISMAFGE